MLKILNICVVTLSAIGLVSTFFLLYGLAKVNTHTSRAGKKKWNVKTLHWLCWNGGNTSNLFSLCLHRTVVHFFCRGSWSFRVQQPSIWFTLFTCSFIWYGYIIMVRVDSFFISHITRDWYSGISQSHFCYDIHQWFCASRRQCKSFCLNNNRLSLFY